LAVAESNQQRYPLTGGTYGADVYATNPSYKADVPMAQRIPHSFPDLPM
jgi:hypothetical protein